MKSITLTLIAALFIALAAAQSLGLFGGGSPTILSPAGLPVVLPAFMGLPLPTILAIPVAAFLVFCMQLLRGESRVPVRFIALACISIVLSFAWYVSGWSYGVKYQGQYFTTGCAIAGFMLLAIIGVMLIRAKSARSFPMSLTAQSLFFIWLVTYAFPYLGEAP